METTQQPNHSRIAATRRKLAAWPLFGLLLLASPLLAQTYPATLGNTATASPPAGVTDPAPANNSATDSNALAAQAALTISKTLLTSSPAAAGSTVRYRIQISNAGPSAALGAIASDTVPAQLSAVTWTCTASPGSSCAAGSGSGNVSLALNLLSGGSATLDVSGTAPTTTPATIAANTASISVPANTSDPTPGDNTATTPAVPVAASALDAVNDVAGPIDGGPGQANVVNVLANDTLNGLPVLAAQVLLTPANVAPLTINANGAVDVAAGTPTGVYTASYQICEAGNPGNCDNAQVTVTVNAAATIDASDDAFAPRLVGAPAALGNVLANDTLNGGPVGALVTLTAPAGALSIAADGQATLDPAAAPGIYSTTYQICETAFPANCDSAVASVRVFAPIDAVADAAGPINGSTGVANVLNVLDNDSAGGATPATLDSVSLAGAGSAQIQFNADGSVTVPPGTAAGTYTASYTLCYLAAPSLCDSASVQLVVAAPGALQAVDDAYSGVNGTLGGSVGNVRDNDSLNGGPATTALVSIAPVTQGPLSIAADGVLSLAGGTPAGSYTISYLACEIALPENCDGATVTVNAATIEARTDTLPSARAGAVAGNVLANDFVDGVAATAGEVTLTVLSSSPGLQIAANGDISVAAGTPAGPLAGRYRICQIAFAAVCAEADVAVTVGVGSVIAADDVIGPVNGATGGAAGNVLDNDTLDGAPPAAGTTTLAPVSSGPISIAADGSVTVAPATAAGSYTATYTLCETLNPGNCDSAQVTVSVSTVQAGADTLGPINGAIGGTAGNVLANDSIDGATPTPLTVVVTPANAGPISIGADGVVHIEAGTPAGDYSASYTICSQAAPTICDGASVAVSVVAIAALDAVDDVFGPADGTAGNANLGNVLGNDTRDGAAVVAGTVTLTSTATAPLAIAADGTVSLAAGTATGVYSGGYQICEIAQPDNCDFATVTVSVRVTATLLANDDGPVVVNGAAGAQSVINLLANDTYNGAAIPPNTVNLTHTASAPVSVDADGNLSVAPAAAPGTVTFSYTICDINDPPTCDSASVTLRIVVADARDDALTLNGSGVAGNVLGNDLLDGAAATPSNVVVSATVAAPLSISPDGNVVVAANTPAGTYSGSYTICAQAAPTICDGAVISVAVGAGSLVANDDLLGPADGGAGGSVGNVLANDTLNGGAAAIPAVTLTPSNAGPISIAADGAVSIAPGTGAGVYSAGYTVCEALNPGNCDAAQVQVTVTTLAANDDSLGPINGSLGGTAGNVLGNDRLDGLSPDPGQVTLTPTHAGPLTIGADGVVTVAPDTAPGSYTASYTICQLARPTVCDGASVTVSVVPNAALDAVNDVLGPVDGVTGSANLGNVLANDLLDGVAVTAAQVTLLPTAAAPLAIAADGTVSVAAGAAGGSYSATYQICEVANPGNCDTATVSVTVHVIQASDDAFAVSNGAAGGIAGLVFANDLLDGAAANPANLVISGSFNAPLSLESEGRVRVAPNTAAGTYTGNYTVCVRSAPTVCGSATVSVTVGAAALVANDDSLGPINGATGAPSAGNVLANDRLGDGAVSAADVVVTPVSAGPISIAGNGVVSVAAATPAGTYAASYTVCQALNPAQCASAQVSVRVTTLDATDDTLGPVNATLGGVAGNVLTNDRLDGDPPGQVEVILTGTATAPLSISTDGTVRVAPGSTPGTYTATYQICQVQQPTICDGASFTVTVLASAALDAADDAFGPVDGVTGNANAGNVLTNDRFDGGPIDPPSFTLTSAATAPLSIAPDGVLSVAATTPGGLYTATYTLCEVANPGNCDTATVNVRVQVAAALLATDDGPLLVDGATGNANAGNVLANDAYNGASVPVGAVVVSSTAVAPITVSADGRIVVGAGAAPGPANFTYTMCESINSSNCASANVLLRIVVVDARNDALTLTDTGSGGLAGNVLGNDLLDGAAAAAATVTVQGALSAPLSLAADGSVTVAPGAPAGVYTGNYQICATSAPAICDSASVVVTVTRQAQAISAADDAGSLQGRTGGIAIASVLNNDRLGGVQPLPSTVTITLVSPSPQPGVVFDASSGAVSVAAGTPAGVYALPYRICEQSAPANCATATARVTVAAGQIDAVDDVAGPIDGTDGAAGVVRVLANDTLDGAAVSRGQVTLTLVNAAQPLSLRDDGQVDLAARTPAGTYTITYRLCEAANPANCDTATVTITVGMPPIIANNDAPPPVPGGQARNDIINVLANDRFDDGAAVMGEVMVIPVVQGPLTLQADGTVDLAAGAAGGTYTLTYQICDVVNPSHCATATVTVVVMATLLTATDDAAQTPQDTPVRVDVLANDQYAAGVVDPAQVVITVSQAPANGAVVVNADGSLQYTPGQYYSGADGFQYRVCERAAPDNCVTAQVSLTVLANTVTAVDDAAMTRGATLDLGVLDNDSTSHAPLDPASLSLLSPPQHGQASCTQGRCQYTPAEGYVGEDRFTYRICDRSTPTPVCAQATVIVDVQAAPAVLRVSKRAESRQVQVGDLVRYSIRIDNVGDVDAVQVPLLDSLPAGFSYVQGSLQVADGDGAGAVNGIAPLRIGALDIAVGQSATLSYVLRVGAGVGPGVHTNRAIVRTDDGVALSNEASADVEVVGDPMLQDSLLIGTVFHDANGNGQQDPGERGLAGVRLGTVEGLLIETDRYGRFHLVGIDGGRWARGRNFLIKVDAATLPAGSTFTTPNPRVQRITPGIPVRFDFGVRIPGMEGH